MTKKMGTASRNDRPEEPKANDDPVITPQRNDEISPVKEQEKDPGVVLQQWRTRILNGFLILAAVAASIGTIITILDVLPHPDQWSNAIVYIVLSLVLIILSIFRKIDNRIRTWGLLLVAYLAGLSTLWTIGLGGSGRLYLLSLPVIALILLGIRSGIIMSVVSILTYLAFTLLAGYSTTWQLTISERSSLNMADWLAEGSDTLMLLVVMMVLAILFYRFQEGLIEQERRTQKLMEEQNATLEQKIQERTDPRAVRGHDVESRR